MKLVSLFCLIALVLVALLLPGDYEFVLAHPKVTRSNNSNSRYEKRAMSTVAASTSANGSTGSSALELPSAASSDNISGNSATIGIKEQLNNSHSPSILPFLPIFSSTPSISATQTINNTKISTSTSPSTTTTTTTIATTTTNTTTIATTTTNTTTTTTTTTTTNTTTTSTSPTSMPPSSSSGIPQTPTTTTSSSGSNQTPALRLTPETTSNSGGKSLPLSNNDGQLQNSSNSDPATSQPNDQQTNNQNPTADTTGSDGSGSLGGFGGSSGSGGPDDSSSPGGAKTTDNPNNQNFVSQGSSPNKLLGPVIGGTIATLAGFGMTVLVMVRKRKNESLGFQLQSDSWNDYDSIEAPIEPITRFRPASFLFAVRSVVNKLPLPRDSANITGESKFVEKMDFDEY